MDRLIIGLVGPIASGKGMASEYLSHKGFLFEKLSDRVREETLRRGLEVNRKNLQDVGNDLRQNYGSHILMAMTLERHESDNDPICIDGIRNPGELEYLKLHGGLIIGITAPAELRLRWYLDRAKVRGEDSANEEAFYQANNRDLGIGESGTGQQVSRCLELSDYLIENTGTVSELTEILRQIIIKELNIDVEGSVRVHKEFG